MKTLEKLFKKRVYGKQTSTTCISETLQTNLITTSQCEIEIKIAYNENMCIKREKKTTHVDIGEEDIHHHIYIYIYIKDKHNVHKNGHKTGVQEQGGKLSP